MNGNVTEEGIRLDLEWMKRIGIGGVHQFDNDYDSPRIVDSPLTYLTPAWQHAFRYAAELADNLDLEFSIAGSPGFSETGGPWVNPEQAMKKLVWSETRVEGGTPFKGKLAQPSVVRGPFQDMPLRGAWDSMPMAGQHTRIAEASFYSDIAVIAYRAPPSDVSIQSLKPEITSSSGAIDDARLMDGDLVRTMTLRANEVGTPWIQYSFPTRQRIQALTAVIVRSPVWFPGLGPQGWLEASLDGTAFHKVADLPRDGAPQQIVSFPTITARHFRFVFMPSPAVEIAELTLHAVARVNRFEDKGGWDGKTLDRDVGFFWVRPITIADDTPSISQQDVVSKDSVIDLTGIMRSDGELEWAVPPGRWVLLRFGYSLTGKQNHPAPPEGTGLEVDKLNRDHVKEYIDAYLGEYERILDQSAAGRHGLQHIVTESWEAGAQNWTDDMLAEFSRRRGYDMRPWLPVLAGRIVQSSQASDRFLWDFRKTLAELVADEHYGQISVSLKERGMRLYSQSHENGRKLVADGMDMKKHATVPMGATWTTVIPGGIQVPSSYDADIGESASVPHLYGQNLVAAESFTTAGNSYGYTPERLKPTADRMLANGVNQFVISLSPHQPDNRLGPGIGVGPFGQWFTRKETWSEQARPWITYLARSSYLLQQGRFVADVVYFYGEDSNITLLYRHGLPDVPAGYAFDFINADALLNLLTVKGGRLVTPSGMSYRMLAIDPRVRRMTLPVLRRIADLVKAGAVVLGKKPEGTPSLADDDAEFQAIANALWTEGAGIQAFGSGRVTAGQTLTDALLQLQLPPDFSFDGLQSQAQLRYVHRALDRGHIYFVSSTAERARAGHASFRVTGFAPELWRAHTGETEPLSYRIEAGRTVVPLKLQAHEAVFVVFRKPAAEQARIIREPTRSLLASLQGPWEIDFPPDLGAPAHIRVDKLQSWTEHPDRGVKYFSGTATYSKNIFVKRTWLTSRLVLDLGMVKDLAEVMINGRSMGILWKPPFTLDVTDALKAGENRLTIKVTNLWVNRLIGDKQAGMRKIAFATYDPFKADSPLLPSGLLGPVTLWKSGARESSHLSVVSTESATR